MPLKVKNIAAGYIKDGVFHPIRASKDYEAGRVGEPFDYKKISKAERARKAKRAEEIAKASRASAKRRKSASRAVAAKRAAGKKPKTGKARLAKKAATKAVSAARKAARKNPIPVSRWVPAKIRRTKSGDIKVMIPLR